MFKWSTLIFLSLTLSITNVCLAQDKQKPLDSEQSPEAATSNSTDQKVLEGQIKSDSIALTSHLKELTSSLHHLKRAAFDIYCETQRQDQVVAVQPDVIGPIILPAIPAASGVLSMGTLPPRKQWLDYFMNQVGQLLPMVDAEINAIVMPQEIPDEGKEDLNQIRELARGLNPLAVNLDKITQGPELKADDIARSAIMFQDQVSKIEKSVKSLSKQVKIEEKKADKELRQLKKK